MLSFLKRAVNGCQIVVIIGDRIINIDPKIIIFFENVWLYYIFRKQLLNKRVISEF